MSAVAKNDVRKVEAMIRAGMAVDFNFDLECDRRIEPADRNLLQAGGCE